MLELARLNRSDLLRYREVCALVEVAKSPPRDMTTEQAKRAWIDYYGFIEDIHEKYGIDGDDSLNVTLTLGSGRFVIED